MFALPIKTNPLLSARFACRIAFAVSSVGLIHASRSAKGEMDRQRDESGGVCMLCVQFDYWALSCMSHGILSPTLSRLCPVERAGVWQVKVASFER